MESPAARLTLATNLKARRNELGLSQEDLALEAGLHRTFVAHVERGVRNISIDNIEKLAIALKIEAYWLLMPPEHQDRPAVVSDTNHK